MNLHMIRAVRLVNARQRGMQTEDFVAALFDADRKAAFAEWLRRRSGVAWLAAEDSALLLAMVSDADLLPLIAPQAVGIKAARDIIFASAAASAAVASHSGAMSVVAGSADAMVDALSSSTALTAMLAVPAARTAIMSSTALAIASVPKMTSDTAPSGIVSSSSVYSGFPAYNAFDKSAGTFWAGGAGLTTNQWIQYSFAGEVFISTVTALPYGAGYNPVNCRIECSDDNLTFDVVKSFVMNPVGVNTLDVTKAGFYKHWRLFIETIDGSSHPGVNELNFTGFVKP